MLTYSFLNLLLIILISVAIGIIISRRTAPKRRIRTPFERRHRAPFREPK